MSKLTLNDYIHAENKFGVKWLRTQDKPQSTTTPTYWVCSCGQVFLAKYDRVKYRNDRCGCGYGTAKQQSSIDKFTKYIGQKFGKLTVLELSFINNHSRFVCQCQCGSIKDYDVRNILRVDGKATLSCGCSKKVRGKENTKWTGGKYISGKFWYTINCCKVRSSRVLDFDITLDYIEELLEKQNFRCAISGEEIYFGSTMREESVASLDRIDNSKGYIKGNVQWVHKIVNELKWDLKQSELVDWCHKISDFQRK